MKIYEKVKRFHPVSGNPVEKWVFKEIRCDYTGEVLDYENHYCTYLLDYGDQDPCLGSSGDEYKLGEDFIIDMFTFLSQAYHFLSVGGSDTKEHIAEWQMMEMAMKNCHDPESEWYRCYTFDAICRTARVRTARRLIEDNIITPKQLEYND